MNSVLAVGAYGNVIPLELTIYSMIDILISTIEIASSLVKTGLGVINFDHVH
jgi:hypothetical protein